jgi:phage-related minor tail protein
MAITLADLIVYLRADDSELDSQLDNAERKSGNFLTSVTGGAARAFGTIAIGGATALAGVFAAGVTGAVDMAGSVNTTLQGMERRIGEFGDRADVIRGSLTRVFGTVGFSGSMEDAGEAIEQVLLGAGDLADNLSENQLTGMTREALALRDAFGIDVADAMRTASALVRNGVAPSFSDAFSIITTGMQTGVNSTGDLIDTLTEYADDFGDLGFSGGETLAILNAGLEAGALNTDKIGDALNEFGVNLRDPAIRDAIAGIDQGMLGIFDQFQAGEITERAALEGMLGRLNGISDQVTQDQAGVLLFRSMWEDMGASAILALDGMQAGVVETSGSIDMLTERNATLGERGTAALRRVQVALIPLGEAVLGVAEQAMPHLENAAQRLADNMPAIIAVVTNVFRQLRDYIVNQVMPRVGPVLEWLWTVAFPAIANFAQNVLFPALSTLFGWLANTAIPAVVSVVQNVLIPALRMIGQFVSQTLWPVVRDIFSRIRDAVNNVWVFVRDVILPPFRLAFQSLVSMIQAILAALRGDWQAFGEYLRNAIGQSIAAVFSALTNWGGRILRFFGNLIRDIINAFINFDWGSLGRGIVDGITNGIRNFGSSVVDAARGLGQNALGAVQGFLGIRSPSRVAAEQIGQPFAQGIAQGISQAAGDVSAALVGAMPSPSIGSLQAAGAAAGTGSTTTIQRLTINFNGGAPTTAAGADESANLFIEALRRAGVRT